jgi:hypothetical protein
MGRADRRLAADGEMDVLALPRSQTGTSIGPRVNLCWSVSPSSRSIAMNGGSVPTS